MKLKFLQEIRCKFFEQECNGDARDESLATAKFLSCEKGCQLFSG